WSTARPAPHPPNAARATRAPSPCPRSRTERASNGLRHLRVLVAVGRRAAAQQDELGVVRGPQLVAHPRRDHDAVAGADSGLLGPQPHTPRARHEVVDLLGLAMEVLDGRPARGNARLGKALVARLGPRGTGELADRGPVEGDERIEPVEVRDLHRPEFKRLLRPPETWGARPRGAPRSTRTAAPAEPAG